MLLAWGHCDGIAGFDLHDLPLDPHAAISVREVVNFLGLGMVMFLCAGVDVQPRFGQALFSTRRISVSRQLPDLGPIFSDKSGHVFYVFGVHRQLKKFRSVWASGGFF